MITTCLARTTGVATLLALAASLAVTGCASTEAGASVPDDIAIVVGAHANAPAVTASDTKEAVSHFDAAGDRLMVVVAQGEVTSAVYDKSLDSLPANSLDRDEYLTLLHHKVQRVIAGAAADSPEVDLPEAIAFATSGFSDDHDRQLWIIDPGLVTAGAMSMLDGNLYAEPADLVGHLQQSGGLPDLAGVVVRMSLTINVAPQEGLTQDARTQLVAIWTEYFARAGATDVVVGFENMDGEAVEPDLPKVSPVAIERPTALEVEDCTARLSSASIGFEAGSAALSDPDQARSLVEQAYAQLEDCKGDWVVEGSASSEGDEAANLALSKVRAGGVADLVSEVVGVSRDNVLVIGWGEGWPCRKDDLDKQGHLKLQAASYNRSVVVSKVQDTDASRC